MKSCVIKYQNTKQIPSPFGEGVILRPFLHPSRSDEFDKETLGIPAIRYSFGHFTIKPGASWPLTVFTVSDVYYVIQGTGVVTLDGIDHVISPGDVVYVAPHAVRCIKNTGNQDLIYLSIVDPAWQPEFEKQV